METNMAGASQGAQALDDVIRGPYAILRAKAAQQLGIIVDIDRKGLVCRYLFDDTALDDLLGVRLLFPDKEFQTSEIPCATVSRASLEGEVPFSRVPMVKHRVTFSDLSLDLQGQLDTFLSFCLDSRRV